MLPLVNATLQLPTKSNRSVSTAGNQLSYFTLNLLVTLINLLIQFTVHEFVT